MTFQANGGLNYYQIDLTYPVIINIDGIVNSTTSNNVQASLELCNSNDDLITSVSGGGSADVELDITAVYLIPGTYYIVVKSNVAGASDVEVIKEADACRTTTSFNDPLYGCQWHLKNTGQLGDITSSGEDINVEGVWDDNVFGAGINVAVVDDGMQTGHEDLTDNVNTSLNHDYSGNNDVYDPSKARGTRVSGVIAATGDNSLGVRGAAPQAGIYSYNLAGNLTSANAKDAMIRNRDTTAVSVNNWGPEDTSVLIEASSEWEEGVGMGISEGLGGKGVFYVWAAGDGDKNSNLADHANFDEYSNYYAVTAVCSVDGEGNKSSFSEEGVNLWVCAPGEDITTTDNNNGYVFDASGTAYSAAQVAGVAALMREVNSDLSWRDLKLILAASARKNDASDTDWETGAHKYGSDTESYNYNPKYGFGVVDAEAATGLAESWTNVPRMRTQTDSSGTIDMAIPDYNDATSTDGVLVSRLTVPDTSLSFTEFVEIELNFSHTYLPDLNIQITSPDGTVSQLTEIDSNSFGYTDKTHRFGSARHLGEDPAGEWTLKISDTVSDDTGTLHSWSIKVYGHSKEDTVTPPTQPGPTATRRPGTPGADSGGGGCAVSDQRGVIPDLLGAVACLMLIPVSVVIRRKIRSHIKM